MTDVDQFIQSLMESIDDNAMQQPPTDQPDNVDQIIQSLTEHTDDIAMQQPPVQPKKRSRKRTIADVEQPVMQPESDVDQFIHSLMESIDDNAMHQPDNADQIDVSTMQQLDNVDQIIQSLMEQTDVNTMQQPPPPPPPPVQAKKRSRKRTVADVEQAIIQPGWVPKPSADCPIVSWTENGNIFAVQNPSNKGQVLLKMEIYDGTDMVHMCGIYLDKDSEAHTSVNQAVNHIENMWIDKKTGVPKIAGLSQTVMPQTSNTSSKNKRKKRVVNIK